MGPSARQQSVDIGVALRAVVADVTKHRGRCVFGDVIDVKGPGPNCFTLFSWEPPRSGRQGVRSVKVDINRFTSVTPSVREELERMRTGINRRTCWKVVEVEGRFDVDHLDSRLKLFADRITISDRPSPAGAWMDEQRRCVAGIEANHRRALYPQRGLFLGKSSLHAYSDLKIDLPTRDVGMGAQNLEAMMVELGQIEAADCDYVVIARGGGSSRDLLVFNDARLAKAIAECEVPVIIGIGHDRDRFLIERVSESASTPSGVVDVLRRWTTATAVDLAFWSKKTHQRISDIELQRSVYFIAVDQIRQDAQAAGTDAADRIARHRRRVRAGAVAVALAGVAVAAGRGSDRLNVGVAAIAGCALAAFAMLLPWAVDRLLRPRCVGLPDQDRRITTFERTAEIHAEFVAHQSWRARSVEAMTDRLMAVLDAPSADGARFAPFDPAESSEVVHRAVGTNVSSWVDLGDSDQTPAMLDVLLDDARRSRAAIIELERRLAQCPNAIQPPELLRRSQ
jgi:Exonuclease VII, large subunit